MEKRQKESIHVTLNPELYEILNKVSTKTGVPKSFLLGKMVEVNKFLFSEVISGEIEFTFKFTDLRKWTRSKRKKGDEEENDNVA